MGAREYDPRVGRWLQRDPIEVESGDPNLYRYCGNDPINLVDPTGLIPAYFAAIIWTDPATGLQSLDILDNIGRGQAIGRRRGGHDVLVRDSSLESARKAAKEIEDAVPGKTIHHPAHTNLPRIVNPRPHYQTPGHPGHTFYEARGMSRPSRGLAKGLRGAGRALGVLGLALGAFDIAHAATDPCGELGAAIGGFAGGIAGAEIGAAIGTAILPGPGTFIGGLAGGIAGWFIGDQIGSHFDRPKPECDCL